MKNKWNQKIVILAAAALTLTAGAAVKRAMAYFTTYVAAEGGYQLDLGFSVTVPSEDVIDWAKHIKIQNTGENACYVRVKVFAGSRYKLTYTDQTGGKWLKGKDDYYYWTEILSPMNTKDEGGEFLDRTGELWAIIDQGTVESTQDQQQSINVIVVQECTPVPYDENGGALPWNEVNWDRTADVVKIIEGNGEGNS